MSVSSSTSRVSFVGNNSTTTAYVVPFVFFDATDLSVVVNTGGVPTTLVNGTGYTVTGGSGATGSLLTTAAIPATSTVIITRSVPYTQLTSFTTGDRLPAASIEKALDKLTMSAQQLSRNNLPDTSTASGAGPYVLQSSTAGADPAWVPQSSSNLEPNSITTPLILNGAVTYEKLSTGGPTWNASGTLTATSFNGPVTGAVTGNVTGNVTGAGNSTFAGNVGIGTSSPTRQISLQKGSNQIRLDSNAESTGLSVIRSSGATEFSVGTEDAKTLSLMTNNTTRLAIDLNGTMFAQGNPITNCKTTAKAWVNFNGTTPITTASGTYTRSLTTVTVTTPTVHGMSTGFNVLVTAATDSGLVTLFPSFVTITVTSTTKFTFTTASTGATSGSISVTTQSIRSSYNVSSITKNGTGDYTVNFETPMADTNYSVAGIAGYMTVGQGHLVYEQLASRSTSSVRVNTITAAPAAGDSPAVQLSVFGK
jgi:hypothetical protein